MKGRREGRREADFRILAEKEGEAAWLERANRLPDTDERGKKVSPKTNLKFGCLSWGRSRRNPHRKVERKAGQNVRGNSLRQPTPGKGGTLSQRGDG